MRYTRGAATPRPAGRARLAYQEKKPLDAGGFSAVLPTLRPWPPSASLDGIANSFRQPGYQLIDRIDQGLSHGKRSDRERIVPLLMKAACFNYEGEPSRAYQVLEQTRSWVLDKPALNVAWRYSIIYFQGVTALRRGENDNCIDVPGRELVHPADRARRRPHQSRRARGWRSSISPSTSSGFPTTSRSAGCSTWPT